MSTLDRLQGWYLSQCDDVWERRYGVEIGTLDNPGWQVRIDLEHTRWAGREFTPAQVDRSEHDWYRCWVDGTQFRAAAGPCNLDDVLHVFLDWVGAADEAAPSGAAVDEWLRQRWLERGALARDDDEDGGVT